MCCIWQPDEECSKKKHSDLMCSLWKSQNFSWWALESGEIKNRKKDARGGIDIMTDILEQTWLLNTACSFFLRKQRRQMDAHCSACWHRLCIHYLQSSPYCLCAFLTIDSTSKGISKALQALCTDYITACKASWVWLHSVDTDTRVM